MPQERYLLTKSGYLHGLQCHKLLWIYENDRASLPEPDEAQQAIFDQGHLVGDLAKKLFPGGVEIDWTEGRDAGVARSIQLLLERKPLFEAGFVHDGTHSRADILSPAPGGAWDLIEVKSSTRVADIHVADIAFQKRVLEGAGIPVRRCFVMHIDNTYVRNGDLEPARLFALEDLTSEVNVVAAATESHVARMLSVASMPDCPDIDVGRHCTDPYDCALRPVCWAFLPERSVFSLIRGSSKSYMLKNRGILRLTDIPPTVALTPQQAIQVACEKSGEAHVNVPQLRAFLRRLKYPLHFLDFETFMTAVPPYDRLRPYEQVPFQYSLHTVDARSAAPRHSMFLADGAVDPRPELLSRLQTELGTSGSIVAYNASFEIRVLEGCVAHFPEYGQWFRSLRGRFVDLMEPFRQMAWYHPDQEGSVSLKAVFPALTGRGYESLEIADGSTASRRFLDMAFGGLPATEKSAIRSALEAYCRLDTDAMIAVLRRLRDLS